MQLVVSLRNTTADGAAAYRLHKQRRRAPRVYPPECRVYIIHAVSLCGPGVTACEALRATLSRVLCGQAGAGSIRRSERRRVNAERRGSEMEFGGVDVQFKWLF